MDTSKNPERRWVWVSMGKGRGQWSLMNINSDDPAYEGSKAYEPGKGAPDPLTADTTAKNKKRTTDS